jgi:uncharacterized protein (DUF488 family)
LLTVGHGTCDADPFAALLVGAGVARVVDVRSFPGSRRHPHMGREAMAVWLPDSGVDYVWEPRLGGRRRAHDPQADPWWRVEAFRAYADHMRSEEFVAGFDRLAGEAVGVPTAIMCSESLWWRCHRRMIADYAVAVRGWTVQHLGHDSRLTPHVVAAGARVDGGRLYYDCGPS